MWPAIEDRPYTLKTFLFNLRPVQLQTQQTGAYSLDLKRFEDGIGCITRGLFFKETRHKLRQPLDVMWSVLRFSSSLEAPFLPLIQKWEALLPPTYIGENPRVFQYAIHYFQGTGHWVCRMRFYEGPPLYVHWVEPTVLEFVDVVARQKFAIRGRADQLVQECRNELQTALAAAVRCGTQDFDQFRELVVSLADARPFQDNKKGAQGGVAGKIFFRDHPDPKQKPQVIIFSVKGGHLKLDDVRALDSVVKAQGAAIGVLIFIEEPTKPMVTEAAGGGFYTSAFNGQKFPRVQLRTIEQLLAGVQIERPSGNVAVDETFKKAPKAKGKDAAHPELGFAAEA